MGFGVNIPPPGAQRASFVGELARFPNSLPGCSVASSQHFIREAEIQAKIALLGRLGWCMERVRPLVDTNAEGAYYRTDPADLACDFPRPGTCPRLHRTDSAHPGPTSTTTHQPARHTCRQRPFIPPPSPILYKLFCGTGTYTATSKPSPLSIHKHSTCRFSSRLASAFTHSSASA